MNYGITQSEARFLKNIGHAGATFVNRADEQIAVAASLGRDHIGIFPGFVGESAKQQIAKHYRGRGFNVEIDAVGADRQHERWVIRW